MSAQSSGGASEASAPRLRPHPALGLPVNMLPTVVRPARNAMPAAVPRRATRGLTSTRTGAGGPLDLSTGNPRALVTRSLLMVPRHAVSASAMTRAPATVPPTVPVVGCGAGFDRFDRSGCAAAAALALAMAAWACGGAKPARAEKGDGWFKTVCKWSSLCRSEGDNVPPSVAVIDVFAILGNKCPKCNKQFESKADVIKHLHNEH